MMPSDIGELRKKLGLTSQQFWGNVKVYYTTGWRYESQTRPRQAPAPVLELIRLRYQLGIDINKINETNAPIIRMLLEGKPDELETAVNIHGEAATISQAASRIINEHLASIIKENKK